MTGVEELLAKAVRSRRLARETTDRRAFDALTALAAELEAQAAQLKEQLGREVTDQVAK